MASSSDVANDEPLALNAFSTASITGLVVPSQQGDEKSISIQLHRVTPPPLEVTPYVTMEEREIFGSEVVDKRCFPDRRPPDRLPSQLPEPGNLNLSLSLDTLLGFGSSSQAFSTTLSGESIHLGSRIPPLVVKVVLQARTAVLVREASIYEELESIQGIAIPRCYGLFKGQLPDGFSLIDARATYRGPYYNDSSSAKSHIDITPLPEGATDNIVFEGHPPVREYLRRSNFEADEVYILVLEKLGCMSKTTPRKSYGYTREQYLADLAGIAEDIGRLCIEQGDVKESNLAEAGDPQWRTFCPRHQCRHAYRFLDFSHAFKRELLWEVLNQEYSYNIERVASDTYDPI